MTRKNTILAAVTLIVISIVFARGPIPQDPSYHLFADQRTIFGIPNGMNVLSNIGFIFTGAWGMVFIFLLLKQGGMTALLLEYLLFFFGVFLSGMGSCVYHYQPDNISLVWDRLPMSMAFMAFLCSMISERIDRRAGAMLLAPLLATGAFSVAYWAWSESAGRGDLRLYAVVQFLPLILLPLILILFKAARSYSIPVWSLAVMYVLSKILEHFDQSVYAVTGFVSGHTLKHVLAAAGTGCIVIMLYNRKAELTDPHHGHGPQGAV
ncbi:MAG: hypothetical protein A2X58_04180 [Nitrospirae bacterium GWC2_56_14]|nr:MAG: hypothetical protein A2X58_04180 [Nitrospirae bacterium GWC2_56_14]